jgi:hypothetical protein
LPSLAAIAGFARDEEPGAFDDRYVDHLAVDGDGTDAGGERRVIGGEHPTGVRDLVRARPEFLVQDRDLARMDDHAPVKPRRRDRRILV